MWRQASRPCVGGYGARIRLPSKRSAVSSSGKPALVTAPESSSCCAHRGEYTLTTLGWSSCTIRVGFQWVLDLVLPRRLHVIISNRFAILQKRPGQSQLLIMRQPQGVLRDLGQLRTHAVILPTRTRSVERRDFANAKPSGVLARALTGAR